MWVKVRATEEQRTRWHAAAEARGVSLSELVRRSLDGVRAVRRRHQPRRVDPELLRELARIGNNLNQLARWANREKRGADAVAVVARLIELDRELTRLRQAHEVPIASASGDAAAPEDAAC